MLPVPTEGASLVQMLFLLVVNYFIIAILLSEATLEGKGRKGSLLQKVAFATRECLCPPRAPFVSEKGLFSIRSRANLHVNPSPQGVS